MGQITEIPPLVSMLFFLHISKFLGIVDTISKSLGNFDTIFFGCAS